MVNWNKVVKTLKNIADAHGRAKETGDVLMSSAANGIWAVKQAADDYETALKTIARMCDKCGVSTDAVFHACDSAASRDEKVKALLFNRNIIGPIIEACNTDETNDIEEG